MPKNIRAFFYSSVFFNRFLNKMMRSGKKEKFETIFIKVLLKIARYSKLPVFFIFFEILEKQKCFVSFKRIIKKKYTQMIPLSLKRAQQYWLAVSLTAKSIKSLEQKIKISQKIISCFRSYFHSARRKSLWGIIEKKRLYNLAVENRYLIHYRW